MRKKYLVLIIVFILTFIPGTYLQTLEGVMFNDSLWRQTKPNHFELSKDSYLALDGNRFELSLNNRVYTGEKVDSEEDEIIFSFDEGWSLIYPADPYRINITFSTMGYISGGEGKLRIDDLNKMPLRFMAPGITERNPITDANGYIVGESVHVLGEDGKTTLAYTEEWYEESEFNSPILETVVISNGLEIDVHLSDRCVVRNEAGEYLLNRDDLFYLQHNGAYISKAFCCTFVERAMDNQIVQRGSLWIAFMSALLYWFGACSFLYARRFALWGERWKYNTEIEPSESYLFTQKASGVVLMVVSILLLYLKY